jgi:starvation-inducible DNA-binding protein
MKVTKETNSALSAALATCLANATIMYHRVHGFHWNIVGPDFPQWHSKFEEIYDDVYGSLDPLAENIRKISGVAPFRLSDLAIRATVADDNVGDYSPQTLISSLLATNYGVLDSLNNAFQMANSANQQGIANFLAERIDAHQKWNWQLSVSRG